MSQTLEQFAKSCHDALKAEPGPPGRRKVCALVQDALKDQAFIGAHFDDKTTERHLLYQDPELGFCIFAHNYKGPKESPPHDHGPSWAIYGQVQGETKMSDWDLLSPASAEKAGKVRYKNTYKLVPGDAHVYNEGDLHSPSRAGPTRLLRIEGTNMDAVKRFKYEPVEAAESKAKTA
jgi:predicted metal-dependent enzyme (double-stranded beta helix superfamily)